MISDPGPARSDTADWTWVLHRACPECGFDAGSVGSEHLAAVIADTAPGFRAALKRPDVGERPAAGVWSPQEYASHVRDVCRVMTRRLAVIRRGDGVAPVAFESWDQNVAATEYWREDPSAVSTELADAIAAAATAFAAVPEEQWLWRGVRGDGVEFTALSLGQYTAHELHHHLWDVTRQPEPIETR